MIASESMYNKAITKSDKDNSVSRKLWNISQMFLAKVPFDERRNHDGYLH
jgi:hypothetical protein